MYDEIAGVIKVFFIVWIIASIVFFLILGLNKWAFWGAIGIGCIASVIVALILSLLTGVTTINVPFSKENKNK